MPDADDNLIAQERLEPAARLAHSPWRVRPDVALDVHVAAAVDQHFPTPATHFDGSTDTAVTQSRLALEVAVIRRATELQHDQDAAESDVVDEASERILSSQ